MSERMSFEQVMDHLKFCQWVEEERSAQKLTAAVQHYSRQAAMNSRRVEMLSERLQELQEVEKA